MAHKKSGGSSRNGRDSHSKRLGVKKYGGENVGLGRDHTLFATATGAVKFTTKRGGRCYVSILAAANDDAQAMAAE